jgi:hypothetical protein
MAVTSFAAASTRCSLFVSNARARHAANPASVFCAKSGGKTEIRKGPRGQYGVCRLPNGRVVDEWAYFRAMRAKRPH